MVPTRLRGSSTPRILLAVFALTAIGVYSLKSRSNTTNAGKLAEALAVERSEKLADTATVLTAVRELARLESVSFHMEKVIDLQEEQTRLWGLVKARDAIVLVAAGDVVAGLDLSKLKDGDMVLLPDAHTVHLRLPPPEILSVSLDSQRTYVHSRSKTMLAQHNIDMESRARSQGEASIRAAALEAGILERARTTGGQTLTSLLRSLGYDRVELSWQER